MKNEEIVRKELRLIIREMGLLNHNCLNSELTLVQAHILNYLEQNGITNYNELLHQLGIDKASLSRTLVKLEEKALVRIEQCETDKRMKRISLLDLGLEAIKVGDNAANKYIGSILKLGTNDDIEQITDAIGKLRMLTLKNNFIKNPSRAVLEAVSSNYRNAAMNLVEQVFSGEQNIPKELIPIDEKFNPKWWQVRFGEDIIGVSAGWVEGERWHWGRFCIDKRLRGAGLGKRLALFSISEIFKLGVEEIYSEARPVTLKLLEKIGCEPAGKSVEFYGDLVTPVVIKQANICKFR